MTEADRRYPVFVYGTLRPGQSNWERLLAAAAERVVAGRLAGVVLLDCGRYPAAVERPGAGHVVGDVVWIRSDAWLTSLAGLDHLEGYEPADGDPLYERVVRSIDTADGPVDCWVYLAGRRLAGSARPVVSGGDWVDGRVAFTSKVPPPPGRPPAQHGEERPDQRYPRPSASRWSSWRRTSACSPDARSRRTNPPEQPAGGHRTEDGADEAAQSQEFKVDAARAR